MKNGVQAGNLILCSWGVFSHREGDRGGDNSTGANKNMLVVVCYNGLTLGLDMYLHTTLATGDTERSTRSVVYGSR